MIVIGVEQTNCSNTTAKSPCEKKCVWIRVTYGVQKLYLHVLFTYGILCNCAHYVFAKAEHINERL